MAHIDASVDLHYRDAHSDKVYSIALVGNEVHTSYGRRGDSRLQPPKLYPTVAKAKQEYIRIVQGKLNKGYRDFTGINGDVWAHLRNQQDLISPTGRSINNNGPAMQNIRLISANETLANRLQKSIEKTPSGFKPQLLNEISEKEAQQYIHDDNWGAQEKKNGRRHTVLVTGNPYKIIGSNKLGITIPTCVTFAVEPLQLIIDGEIIGQKLYVFDLLNRDHYSLMHLPYLHRHSELTIFCRDYCNSSVELVPLWTTKEAKQELWDRVKTAGGEGVVFKKLKAEYKEGRPNRLGDQLKVVFWQHTQAIVIRRTDGKTDRRSVAIACWNTITHDWIPVGNVTIPPNYEKPKLGDFVEIRYKYYYEGGSLFQPQYEGTTDVATAIDTDFNKLLRFPGDE